MNRHWTLVTVMACTGASAPSQGGERKQIETRVTVPLQLTHTPEERGLRHRIGRILERDVQFEFEYETFIGDLTSLGRRAVPHILDMVDGSVSDRYVTESLVRVGGPAVRAWVERVLDDPDPHWRQAFVAGFPEPTQVSLSLWEPLEVLLYDRSLDVRILAAQKLYSVVPADRLIALCRDPELEVVRVATEVVSEKWLHLDHGRRELENLASFVSVLELHYKEEDWRIGPGFALAFQKERVARSEQGQQLQLKMMRLPWFKRGAYPLTASKLASIREQLSEGGTNAQEVLTEALSEMMPGEATELLLVLSGEADVEVRLAACTAGMTLLDPALAGSFVRFLKDPDSRVRERTRELLEETSFYAEQLARWK